MFFRQNGPHSSHRTLIRKRGFIVLPFDKSSDYSDYNIKVDQDGTPRSSSKHQQINNENSTRMNSFITNNLNNSMALFDRPLKILSLSKKDDDRQAKREHTMKVSMALHQYNLAKE